MDIKLRMEVWLSGGSRFLGEALACHVNKDEVHMTASARLLSNLCAGMHVNNSCRSHFLTRRTVSTMQHWHRFQ